ncbi:J protein JJJ2-like [Durio zibethinus]|uniref:J protein JJJ2-like n=1 Tax=Durio zibethinus TaxID=66656 RepID=A0A6P5WMW3_DURZI|nr:J protein JJJ2-like [Durio zibethinus]
MAPDPDAEQKAQRLKALAEAKYKKSNLKSALKHAKKAHRLCPNLEGISSMLTAFEILQVASKANAAPDWYKILQVEPFSHINSIKKQYRKLALTLHPDKNPYLGCEEAFKLVGEGFRIFSDKIRRKEYDMKLRIRIQEERIDGLEGNGLVGETFWTACSRCRLLHKFERKYLGHNLVCPSCKKSFLAVEVDGDGGDGESEEEEEEVVASVRVSERVKKRKMGSKEKLDSPKSVGLEGEKGSGETIRSAGLRRKASGDNLKEKEIAEATVTLAEMPFEMRGKMNQGRQKLNVKERVKDVGEKEREKETDKPKKNRVSKNEKQKALEKTRDFEIESQGPSKTSENLGIMTRATKKRSVDLEAKTREGGKKNQNSESRKQGTFRKRVTSEIEKRHGSKSADMETMAVEDSDFYDFDKDRSERNFKKGQVWAIYDDDGMPRHYGLIEEVCSVNPFEVKMSWLDFQKNGDDRLISWEKMGFHLSCGRFKAARKSSINSVNIFSHMVESEREAKEFYRIYPKKGSVWALYNEAKLGVAGRNLSAREKHCYDEVVLLTTYSEIHGLSVAYLERVAGFRTIFKRQEIGCRAIRWLEKDDIQLFSHQIPAWKLSGDDFPDLLKDCWELDPASLPPDLLSISRCISET